MLLTLKLFDNVYVSLNVGVFLILGSSVYFEFNLETVL